MATKRSTFSMNMTETQKKLLDIVAFYESKGYGGRSGAVVTLIRDYIKNFIDCPQDVYLDDDTLLKYASKQYDFDLEMQRRDEEALAEMFRKKQEEHRKLMGIEGGKEDE